MKIIVLEKYYFFFVFEFEIGCKRCVFDFGYLECFYLEKIIFINDKVVEILFYGVKMVDGWVVEVDVLVLVNGFEMNIFMIFLLVVGMGGYIF